MVQQRLQEAAFVSPAGGETWRLDVRRTPAARAGSHLDLPFYDLEQRTKPKYRGRALETDPLAPQPGFINPENWNVPEKLFQTRKICR